LASSCEIEERWRLRRQRTPFKYAVLGLIRRFLDSGGNSDDFVHLDEVRGPTDQRIIWTEGNPIPHWFMLSRGGLHITHFTERAPWAGFVADPSVRQRLPETPVKWPDTGFGSYPCSGQPYVLALDGAQVPGNMRVVRRPHPMRGNCPWTLRSMLKGASVVHTDNPHSGLILTARMMGKPVVAPRGGLFGPLLDNQTHEEVDKCLAWLEAVSVNVLSCNLREQIEAHTKRVAA
jgi:hypothetical protein